MPVARSEAPALWPFAAALSARVGASVEITRDPRRGLWWAVVRPTLDEGEAVGLLVQPDALREMIATPRGLRLAVDMAASRLEVRTRP